jgi:hypothetical protein
MIAPAVASLIVTVCVLVYVPAAGENVGVAVYEMVAVPSDGLKEITYPPPVSSQGIALLHPLAGQP